MVNPVVGKAMPYEEIWRKLAKSTVNGALCLESSGESHDKAFVGRVGEQYQGICVREGRISAVRCVLTEEGKWKEVFRVGNDCDRLPIIDMDASIGVVAGQTVKYGGGEWVVLDVEQ